MTKKLGSGGRLSKWNEIKHKRAAWFAALPKKPTIVVDLDGTILEDSWPELGEFMPGAVDALAELQKHVKVVVFSCRLNPTHPSGYMREQDKVYEEINRVRAKLDDAGLYTIDIYLERGKPHGAVYLDNKGMFYPGRPGSWKALVPKILLKAGVKAKDIGDTGDVHAETGDHGGDLGSLRTGAAGRHGDDPVREAQEVPPGMGAA